MGATIAAISVLALSACAPEDEIRRDSQVESVVVDGDTALITDPLEPTSTITNRVATVQPDEDNRIHIATPDGISVLDNNGTWYGMTAEEIENSGAADLPDRLSSDSIIWVDANHAELTFDLDADSGSGSGSGSGGNE